MDKKVENFDTEFDTLKKAPPEKQRDAFLAYCRKNIVREECGELSMQEAAYKICGAASLSFDQINTEFSEVMDIACDLELPEEHRSRKAEDWEKLKTIIEKASF